MTFAKTSCPQQAADLVFSRRLQRIASGIAGALVSLGTGLREVSSHSKGRPSEEAAATIGEIGRAHV